VTLLIFQVRGTPGAQGSKRVFGKGQFKESSAKVAPWRSDVKAAAEAALLATDEWPHRHNGPVHFTCTFMFPRPKSHYRTGKLAGVLRDDAPIYVTSHGKGDLDKLARSTFDALTAAGVWADDSLAVTGRMSKVYGDDPGAHLILATDNEVTIPSVVSR
jgi:crossover junction endodeoxyribonuclease RusA